MKSYENYKDFVNKNNKGIFLCVCRGKLSEGLNFKDNLARAIFVIGIPFLHLNDSRVILKKSFHDDNFTLSTNPEINGNDWYKLTAIRAVN